MPANTSQWLDHIIKILFGPETRRIDKIITTLVNRNSALKGGETYGFMFLGNVHVPSANKDIFRMAYGRGSNKQIPTLSFELNSEVSAYISDLHKVEADEAQIRQVIFKLIYQANSTQEIRDALPECVARLVFKDIPRFIQDPTWLIRNDPRGIREYERMLPKIEMYAMTQLMY